MRHLGLIFLLIPAIGILADWYIDRALRRMAPSRTRRCLLTAHRILSVLFAADAVAVLCMPVRDADNPVLLATTWMLFIYLSVYLPKFIFVIVDLIGSLPMLWHRRRLRALTYAGAGLAFVLFGAMWWGALVNRFRVQVNEAVVASRYVPRAFDGYRILQLSDIHLGTYGNDTTYVARVVDEANALDVDLILFTGDIVNRSSAEMKPFVTVLSRLKARDGVMAVLGNHDHGDYREWESDAAKAADVDSLKAMYAAAGIDLLVDSYRDIVRGQDTLTVVGVDNISEPEFQTYGSLTRAYPRGSRPAKILMSHNPEHWRRSIAGRPFDAPENDFLLTLAGHTHAMQMEVGGVSPAALRYPLWGGLYSDDEGHWLYVNIGIGTVGFPMRLGATPELTVITLSDDVTP